MAVGGLSRALVGRILLKRRDRRGISCHQVVQCGFGASGSRGYVAVGTKTSRDGTPRDAVRKYISPTVSRVFSYGLLVMVMIIALSRSTSGFTKPD